MGMLLLIIGIIFFLCNLLVLIGTKEDIAVEERRADKAELIAGLSYAFFPIGLILALVNRKKNNRGWYIKFILYISISYIITLPIGFYLLWSGNTFNKRNKIKLTIVSILLILSSVMMLFGVLDVGNSLYNDDSISERVELKIDREEGKYEKLYVIDKDNLKGYINKSGEVILEPKYSYGSRFSEGLAFVMIDDKSFYIDTKGNEVISLDNGVKGKDFSEERAVIEDANGKFGCVNRDGIIMVKPTYEEMKEFKNGYAPVKKSGKWGLIDKFGEEVIEPKYSYLSWPDKDGILPAALKEKIGYMNLEEEFIIRPKYEEAAEFINGYAIVRKSKDNNRHRVINKDGKVLEEFFCNSLEEYSGGVYLAKYMDKYGYVTPGGTIAIKFNYSKAQISQGGVAPVSNNGTTWEFINIDREVAIPDYYVKIISGFDGALAKVEDKEGNIVYINIKGEVVYKEN